MYDLGDIFEVYTDCGWLLIMYESDSEVAGLNDYTVS